MDINQIKALIDAMAASDLAEMEVGKDGWTLRLVRRRATVRNRRRRPRPKRPPAARPPVERKLELLRHAGRIDVRAPLWPEPSICRPSPGEPAFVEIGQAVSRRARPSASSRP